MNSCSLLGDAMFFDVVGNLIWNLRLNNMEEAVDAFGKYGLRLVVRKLSEDDPDLIVIGKKKTNQTSFSLKK